MFLFTINVLRTLVSTDGIVPSAQAISTLLLAQGGAHSNQAGPLLSKERISEMFGLKKRDIELFTGFCQIVSDTYVETGSLLEFYSISLLFHRVSLYYEPKNCTINGPSNWLQFASSFACGISHDIGFDSCSFVIPTLLDAIGLIQQVIPLGCVPGEKSRDALISIYGLTTANIILLYNSALRQFIKLDSFVQGRTLFEFLKECKSQNHAYDARKKLTSIPCSPNVETFKLIFSLYMHEGVVSGNIKDAIHVLYTGLELLSYPLDLCVHATKLLFYTRSLEDIKALYLRVKAASPEVCKHVLFENTFLSCLSTSKGISSTERQLVRDISEIVLSSSGKTQAIHSSNTSFLIGILYRFNRRALGDYINHLPLSFLSDCPMFFSYLIKLMVIDASHRPFLLSLLNERFRIFDSYPEGSAYIDYRLGAISSLFSRNHPQISALLYYWEIFDNRQTKPFEDTHVTGLSLVLKKPKTSLERPMLRSSAHYYLIRTLYLEGNSSGILAYFLYFIKRSREGRQVCYDWISNRTLDFVVWSLTKEHEWNHLCRLLNYFSNSGDGGGFGGEPISDPFEASKTNSDAIGNENFAHMECTKKFKAPLFVGSKYSMLVPRLYQQFKDQIQKYPGNSSPIHTLYPGNAMFGADIILSSEEKRTLKELLDRYSTVRELRKDVLGNGLHFLHLNCNIGAYLRSILSIPAIFIDFCEQMEKHHKELHSHLA